MHYCVEITGLYPIALKNSMWGLIIACIVSQNKSHVEY